MKVVYVKNNDFISFNEKILNGYIFVPKRKSISEIKIIDNNLIKLILNKKLKRELSKVNKTINLIINSNVTLKEDCLMMEDELIRIYKLIESKYLKYFDEFEFFSFVKDIYILNQLLNIKKKCIV